MNRPKLQHYVTRAYLASFLGDNESTLHVYTRGKTTSFRAKPENVAAITNYYSTKKEDGTYDDRIEHIFSTLIEGPGISVIRRLQQGHHQLSRAARVQLAMLLAIQEYRVPWMRERMEEFTAQMFDRFTKAMAKAPGVMENTIKELAVSAVGDEARLAEELRGVLHSGGIKVTVSPSASMRALGHLLNTLPDIYYSMTWDVLESDEAAFITSDCPVHRFYLPIGQEQPLTGLMDMRVQIRFSLSKCRLLVIRHDQKRMQMIERIRLKQGWRAAEQMANAASFIRYFKVSRQEVEGINEHTAAMAARFIFSASSIPNGAGLLAGECQNVRHVFMDRPDGSTEFRSVYPNDTKHPVQKNRIVL